MRALHSWRRYRGIILSITDEAPGRTEYTRSPICLCCGDDITKKVIYQQSGTWVNKRQHNIWSVFRKLNHHYFIILIIFFLLLCSRWALKILAKTSLHPWSVNNSTNYSSSSTNYSNSSINYSSSSTNYNSINKFRILDKWVDVLDSCYPVRQIKPTDLGQKKSIRHLFLWEYKKESCLLHL